MAVYAYPYHHCIVWEAELGRRKLPFGQFRENLTIAGLGEDSTRVGDLFRIGTALFRITQPRIPCRPRLSPVRCHRPSQPARAAELELRWNNALGRVAEFETRIADHVAVTPPRSETVLARK